MIWHGNLGIQVGFMLRLVWHVAPNWEGTNSTPLDGLRLGLRASAELDITPDWCSARIMLHKGRRLIN